MRRKDENMVRRMKQPVIPVFFRFRPAGRLAGAGEDERQAKARVFFAGPEDRLLRQHIKAEGPSAEKAEKAFRNQPADSGIQGGSELLLFSRRDHAVAGKANCVLRIREIEIGHGP